MKTGATINRAHWQGFKPALPRRHVFFLKKKTGRARPADLDHSTKN
jgi:hypothetical protein